MDRLDQLRGRAATLSVDYGGVKKEVQVELEEHLLSTPSNVDRAKTVVTRVHAAFSTTEAIAQIQKFLGGLHYSWNDVEVVQIINNEHSSFSEGNEHDTFIILGKDVHPGIPLFLGSGHHLLSNSKLKLFKDCPSGTRKRVYLPSTSSPASVSSVQRSGTANTISVASQSNTASSTAAHKSRSLPSTSAAPSTGSRSAAGSSSLPTRNTAISRSAVSTATHVTPSTSASHPSRNKPKASPSAASSTTQTSQPASRSSATVTSQPSNVYQTSSNLNSPSGGAPVIKRGKSQPMSSGSGTSSVSQLKTRGTPSSGNVAPMNASSSSSTRLHAPELRAARSEPIATAENMTRMPTSGTRAAKPTRDIGSQNVLGQDAPSSRQAVSEHSSSTAFAVRDDSHSMGTTPAARKGNVIGISERLIKKQLFGHLDLHPTTDTGSTTRSQGGHTTTADPNRPQALHSGDRYQTQAGQSRPPGSNPPTTYPTAHQPNVRPPGTGVPPKRRQGGN